MDGWLFGTTAIQTAVRDDDKGPNDWDAQCQPISLMPLPS